MLRRKRFWRSHEVRQGPFKKDKKGQLVILMCIGLIVIVAFTMMDIQLASAEITEKTLYKTPEYPMAPTNISELQYCDTCHLNDMPDTWITVTVDSQTPGDITYYVTGSSEKFEGIEGWAVFDPLENNKANGFNSGYFTLPKDGQTYRVFWVDNGTAEDPEEPGGSAYTEIIPLNDAPSTPTIDGPTSGEPGTSYTYNFVSTDENGNDISYYIKWGDGSTTDWTAFQASGTPYSESHIWSETGTYTIEAKARDTHGAESEWGTLTVEISSAPDLKIRLKVINIGKVCATIQNKGLGSISDINWNVSVEGGLFRLIKRINANGNGTIETLGAGEKQVVCTPEKSIILRFGIAKVTVTATIGEKTFTHNQFVLVTGRLIFARPLLLRP